MKKFLVTTLLFIFIPVTILLGVYFLTDPFKTLKPFSLQYFDDTNRDYLSTELFLKNYPIYQYDSYIFGSSRGCGINTYHWLKYLPKESRQFMFQAWGETLKGEEQKISYIDKIGGEIKNVILLVDIPGAFSDKQLPTEALSIKDYKFSGQPKIAYQATLFWNFLQKPSFWYSSIKGKIRNSKPYIGFDTISNDWEKNNSIVDVNVQPNRDSLSNCSETVRNVFLREISTKTDADLKESPILINDTFKEQLLHIKSIFTKHGTDYRIIVTPAYCYTHPAINKQDLKTLQDIFGEQFVFDYSGKNELTSDCYNFSDPGHFGLSVGWQIIEDIYNN